ncbi:hypothetical protein ACQKNC_16080 [Lysinibacillus sp. NPDC094177]|uniref:hypothetical protein n=1 Tax=Lysinibacillus sp. NPDC094177 TaxID=3390580 RepID=UPI003CFCB097
MLHNGLQYVGFLIMLIFGGVFLLRWLLHDEILLDQLIAFVIGESSTLLLYSLK